jgi:hypothetical protein
MIALLGMAAFVATLGAHAGQTLSPLPCVPPPLGDSTPWVAAARVLASFPPTSPPPTFVGGFADRNREYELHLWRDATGLFGEILSPVLEADSPTSRLYDTRYDPGSGAATFSARFPDGERRFELVVRTDDVSGSVDRAGAHASVALTKLAGDRMHGVTPDRSYTSRAQFDCAMVLFHRF